MEYSQVAHAVTPFFPTPTLVFTTLHPKSNGCFSFFLEDYKLHQDLKPSSNSFKLAFQCMPHLLWSGPFGMIFEHFWNCFHPIDLASGFFQLFQFYSHIAQGHIPPQIAHVLGAACLLAMIKPSGGIHPIVVEETLYQFTSHTLCL